MSKLLVLRFVVGVCVTSLFPLPVGAQLVGCVAPHGNVTVPFWYLYTSGNPPQGYVERATLSLSDGDFEQVQVGVSEQGPLDIGDGWRVAVWIAVTTVAMLGCDLAFRDISVKVSKAIEGPSAGAMMAVALLAAIHRADLRSNIVMTGTVNPDGTIGPVGDIPLKLQAAQRAGHEEALIPKAQDTPENTQGLTLLVRGVVTVAEAYKLFTGKELVSPAPELQPLKGEMERELRELVRMRIEVAQSLSRTWDSESPKQAYQWSVSGVAQSGQRLLHWAQEARDQGERGAAYSFTLGAIQQLYTALRVTLWLQESEPYDKIIRDLESRSLQPEPMRKFQQHISPALATTSPSDIAFLAAIHAAVENYFTFRTLTIVAKLDKSAIETPLAPRPSQSVDAKSAAEHWLKVYAREAAAVVWGLRARDLDTMRGQPSLSSTFPAKEKIARLVNLLQTSERTNRKFLELLSGQASSPSEAGGDTRVSIGQTIQKDPDFEALSRIEPSSEAARLGVMARRYLITSALVNKYYALGYQPGVDALAQPGDRIGSEAALRHMLEHASDTAKHLIATVQKAGYDATLLLFLYEIGRELRDRKRIEDRFLALERFWEASLYARIILAAIPP